MFSLPVENEMKTFGVGKLPSTKLTCLLYTNFDSSTRGFVLFLTEMECSTFQWGFPLFLNFRRAYKNDKIASKNCENVNVS